MTALHATEVVVMLCVLYIVYRLIGGAFRGVVRGAEAAVVDAYWDGFADGCRYAAKRIEDEVNDH